MRSGEHDAKERRSENSCGKYPRISMTSREHELKQCLQRGFNSPGLLEIVFIDICTPLCIGT
jgi:hypothetical protein